MATEQRSNRRAPHANGRSGVAYLQDVAAEIGIATTDDLVQVARGSLVLLGRWVAANPYKSALIGVLGLVALSRSRR